VSQSVDNELVGSLLDTYRHAPTLEAAEQALEALESCAHDGDPPIGDLYDELAELAAQEENFGLAIRAQRKAVELGCEMPRLGREMLGWYLMKDGRRVAGEAEFDALRTEVGDDPGFLLMLGNARADAGDESAALAAFDEALTTAKQLGDSEAIKTARAERRFSREALGLSEDEDDRLAPRPLDDPSRREEVSFAVAWFPRSEHQVALAEWPALEEDLAHADRYCRRIEQHLRELAATSGCQPSVAPLTAKELLAYGESEGLDPADGPARARLAADLNRRGQTIPWPPGRNEPCWCGSGRKYKRCCGH
jgi:tetratricopeptide (TPR) repeat protein